MSTRLVPFATALSCCLAVAGCFKSDADDAPPADSGVQASTPMNQLTAGEAQQLCDWGAAIGTIGGDPVECGDVGLEPSSLEECPTRFVQFPGCEMTVAAIEACWRLMADDACSAIFDPTCTPGPGCTGPG